MMLKEKYEKFAQGMVIHNNATEAARYAGYTANSSHALANTGHRLKNLAEIKDRIKELEENLETNVDVITEIEKQYDYARANGHTNSAIKALELLSRVRGTQDEKEDNTDPVKLKQDLVDSAKIMGKDFYFEIGKEAGFLNGYNKIDNVDNKEDKE